MKPELCRIAALGLALASSPALASDWTVDFHNNTGQSVWVQGIGDVSRAKVSDGSRHNIKWKEDGCPPSYAIGYFTVYSQEDAQTDNAIVTVEYKYEGSCKLTHYTNDWYDEYGDIYTAVDKGTNKNHERKLTLKPK